ncbi:MAG: RNA pyrophosphohydrolase [Leptospiraceae bacterium]|nr:RNA pyrophosphohydrolase [Leptospiraceae bacterium]MDW7974966.1 RNA pyrophosphohydrolase [Leptospiraceae bacterium]
MKNQEKPYRKNVGILVFNSQMKVLVGDRVDHPENYQLPQGGIDEGENPEDAAIRELYEETGLKLQKPVFEIPEWLSYDFPEHIPEHLKKYRGQTQKWFFFHWDGDIQSLDLNSSHHREFRTLKWMDIDVLVNSIIEFKKEVYLKIQKYFYEFVPEYLKTLYEKEKR